MSEESGILMEGARRVWRYQRVLWWMFAVNFVLAWFSAMPLSARLEKVAGHSAHSAGLANGFDLGAFLELSANPDAAFWSGTTSSLLLTLIFFIFAILLTGGALEAYRAPRKLTTGEFFHVCGEFFWRWVRLLIFLLIVITPICILAYYISDWSGTLSDDAPQEKLGFWVDVIGFALVLFLMMTVRLWFDMAQVRAIATGERAMRRTWLRAARLTFGNFGSLFWIYFRISFLAWLGLALALWIWVKIPGQHSGLSALLFEVLLIWWIATRLWQRASETVWYERYGDVLVAAPEPVPLPEPEMTPAPVTPAAV
jgi:hypothetical protein